MDPEKGRKAIGGKIEVKLRIREPLTDKDVEILTQKWLVIEAFVAPSNRVSSINIYYEYFMVYHLFYIYSTSDVYHRLSANKCHIHRQSKFFVIPRNLS